MSEFHVEVVKLTEKHSVPASDFLSYTFVKNGYPVVFRSDQFNVGDLAVYVPIDALVPSDDPRWNFLDGHNRIKAKKLRGIFSMGMLTKADSSWVEGQNVQKELRIEKYEPSEPLIAGGEDEKNILSIPLYTDIEGFRKYSNKFTDGEEVVVTEKIHGMNARFVWSEDRLWVGSHKRIKRENYNNAFWHIAKRYSLDEKLKSVPDVMLFGEVYGSFQRNFTYGYGRNTTRGYPKDNEKISIVFFDAMSLKTRMYYDYDEFEKLVDELKLPKVPVLYAGLWNESLRNLAEGKTVLGNGKHIREGIVIKPKIERFDPEIGRVVLKLIGEGFHLKSSKKKKG